MGSWEMAGQKALTGNRDWMPVGNEFSWKLASLAWILAGMEIGTESEEFGRERGASLMGVFWNATSCDVPSNCTGRCRTELIAATACVIVAEGPQESGSENPDGLRE